jgi:divalent metal cation (Fe/Co/Zn/Cd) transporter
MSESPNYPQSSASTGPVPAPARPGTVEGAFWAFIVAPVIGLIGGLLIFGNRDQIATTMRDANRQRGGNLTDAQIDQAVNVTMITAMVIAVIIAGLYLLFAFKLRAGRNWARIVLTVLAALQLLSVLIGQSTIGGYLAVLAAVVGVVLSFTGPSNAYFAAAKVQR